MTTPETFPLLDLYIHPLNPRQTHDPAEVEAKMRSIRAVGLAQSLAGYRDPDTGGIGIGIVAGGYRLLALQSLATLHPDQTMVDIDAIPVRVTDDRAVAEAWGIAAQTQTELTPVEEIRAYAQRAHDNIDPATIACEFGVTELRVRRRLKLARLPEPVLDALAAREITLDVAQALTTAPDEARALQVLDVCKGRGWDAHRVKHAMHQGRIRGTDRRAVAVGLDRYADAGGIVERDLFSEDTWLSDETLLDKLFSDVLTTARDRTDGEGWAFVWVTDSAWPSEDPRMRNMERIDPMPIDLPDADQVEFDRLSEIPTWQRTEDESAAWEELYDRQSGVLTDDDIARSGVMIYVNQHGKLDVMAGLIDRAATRREAEQSTVEKVAAPAPPSLGVKNDLHAIATRARQMAMLDKPALALDLLAYQLSLPPSWNRIFALSANAVANLPEKSDGMTPGTLLDTPKDGDPISLDGFAQFRALGQKHRNAVLTAALARLLEGSTSDLAKALNLETRVNPRSIWTPTPAFFARLKAAALDRIADDILFDADPDRLTALHQMKAKDKARELGDLFTDMDLREAWGINRAQAARLDTWIPADMRDELGLDEDANDDASEQEDAA